MQACQTLGRTPQCCFAFSQGFSLRLGDGKGASIASSYCHQLLPDEPGKNDTHQKQCSETGNEYRPGGFLNGLSPSVSQRLLSLNEGRHLAPDRIHNLLALLVDGIRLIIVTL